MSLRMLLLLFDVEDILHGNVPMFSEQHFIIIWKDYLQLCNEKMEMFRMQYGDTCLETTVSVCGNCHDICRKLECVVGMDVLSTKPASTLNYFFTSRFGESSHSIIDHDNNNDDGDRKPLGGEMMISDDALIDDGCDGSFDYDNNLDDTKDNNNHDVDDDVNDNDNDDDNDDDDDSLVPIYNHPSSIMDPCTVSQDTSSSTASLHLTTTYPTIIESPIPIRTLKENNKVMMIKSKSTTSKMICLRDFYAHIGFLFPAIYNVLDFK